MKLKLSALFILVVFVLHAQDSTKMKLPDKKPLLNRDDFFVGGNIGLQFGTFTFFNVSPLAGYRITDKLAAGVGVTYQYLKSNLYSIESNVYGGRLFGRYFFFESFFVHSEYEILNLEAYDVYPSQRVNVGSLFGGVGFIQRWAPNSGLVAMVLYNFTESYYTPYQNPIIRAGVVIGL